jgi:hypothetical protein
MFKPATRSQANAKIAIAGPAGSGKTRAALLIAKGLGGKTAVLDTENNSASLYADAPWLEGWTFDTAKIEAPYDTEKFINGINTAIRMGYTTVIVDSASHEWEGEGALKDQKDTLDATGRGNSFTNWQPITKKHEKFKSALLHSKINVIATMRSKIAYAQVSEGGKTQIKKMGLAPIQREGMEYEFTVMFDLSDSQLAEVSKDRTNLFAKDKPFAITTATGESILNWLKGAKPSEEIPSIEARSVTSVPTEPLPESEDPAESSLGDYIPTVGKFKNSALRDIPKVELSDYVLWLREGETKDRKDRSGKIYPAKKLEAWLLDFVTHAEAYLKECEFDRNGNYE